MTDKDFTDVPDVEILSYNFYGDNDLKQQPKVPDGEEKSYQLLIEWEGTVNTIPTPEEGNKFLNTSIVLLRGSRHCRGKVVSRKHNEEGNPLGKRSESGYLLNDTQIYLVEFLDGKVIKLIANTITTTIYTNCNGEDN